MASPPSQPRSPRPTNQLVSTYDNVSGTHTLYRQQGRGQAADNIQRQLDTLDHLKD